MKLTEADDRQQRIVKLINLLGGNTKFAKRFRIPVRSVENWKRGVNNPPEYVVLLLQYAVDHDLDFSEKGN